MALAILRWQETDDNQSQFHVDLGINRYYTYAIGDRSVQRKNGLKLLENPSFVSPLIGPLPEESLGRTTLKIPNSQLSRQHRFIQLTSYRTHDRIGPAISDIVEVPLSSSLQSTHQSPVLSFGLESSMSPPPVETVPFAYREVKPMQTAEAMGFLSSMIKTVLPAVTKILPAATKAIEQVMPAGGLLAQAVKQAAQVGTQLLQDKSTQTLVMEVAKKTLPSTITADPELLKQLEALLQQAAQIKVNGTSANSPTNGQVAVAQSLTVSGMGSRYSNSYGTTPVTSSSAYAEQMMSPALLAALPELMPVLEKVLTPETIKTVIDGISPAKTIGAITDGIQKFAQLDQAAGKQQQEHLERVLANAGDDAAEKWAYGAALTNAFSATSVAIRYQSVMTVRLGFAEVTTVMLNGRSRPVYSQHQDLAFPLTVETPRPIKDSIVQLLVKHPETLEILIEQKFRVGEVTTGALSVVPKLSREQLRSLPANQDYLVCAALLWSGRDKTTKKKKRLGTSMTQLITLVGEYCFDRMEGTVEVVPLNDVDRFRDYWHKIWEKEFSDSVRRISLDCKYYLTLESERTNHARMETLTKLQADGSTRLNGKLKTGLIMSPYRLNELIPQISSHPSLSAAELAALMTPEFKQQCSYAARSAVEFKGKRGDGVGMWVYPEMKVQRVLLKQAGETNANGQVLALTEREVYFPMPAIVHFIGVGT